MNVKPLNDHIFIKKLKNDEKSAGGLFLAEQGEKAQHKAEVLAVGDCKEFDNGTTRPLKVKVGDTVLVTEWHGAKLTLDQELYYMVREEHIFGIVLPDEETPVEMT